MENLLQHRKNPIESIFPLSIYSRRNHKTTRHKTKVEQPHQVPGINNGQEIKLEQTYREHHKEGQLSNEHILPNYKQKIQSQLKDQNYNLQTLYTTSLNIWSSNLGLNHKKERKQT